MGAAERENACAQAEVATAQSAAALRTAEAARAAAEAQVVRLQAYIGQLEGEIAQLRMRPAAPGGHPSRDQLRCNVSVHTCTDVAAGVCTCLACAPCHL